MTAPLWVNLCFSCIREQFPEEEEKKDGGGGGIKLLAVPCFSYYYLQPQLPKLTGKQQLYFGRMSISLQGGSGTFSCMGPARRNKFVDNCKGSPGKYLLVKSPNRLELNKLENAAIMAEYKFMAFVSDA